MERRQVPSTPVAEVAVDVKGNKKSGEFQLMEAPEDWPEAIDDRYASLPPTPRLEASRKWPQISGTYGQLNQAAAHLEQIAQRRGITIGEFKTNAGDVGYYNPDKKEIGLHQDVVGEPGHYLFALAHELAHSGDPNYKANPSDYNKGKNVKAEFEVVAEQTAINVLKSFGLQVSGAEAQLDKIGYKPKMGGMVGSWRSAVSVNGKLNDRIVCAEAHLMKPSLNPEVTDRRARQLRASGRRVDKQIRKSRPKAGKRRK